MISRLGNPFFPPEWFLESKYSMHLLPRYQSIDRSILHLYQNSQKTLHLMESSLLDAGNFSPQYL